MRLFEVVLVEPFAPLDAGPLVVLVAPETAEFVWLAPKFAEAAWLVSEPGKADPLVPGAEDVDVVSVDVDPPVLGAEDVDVDNADVDVDPPVLGAEGADVDVDVDPPVLGIESVDVDVDDGPGFDAGTLEFGAVVAPLDAGPLAAPVNVLAVVAEGLAVPVNVLAVVAEVLEELGLPETEALELARSATRGTETAWLVGASALIWVGVLAAADVEELDEAGGLTLWAANGGRSVVVEEFRPPLVALARPTR